MGKDGEDDVLEDKPAPNLIGAIYSTLATGVLSITSGLYSGASALVSSIYPSKPQPPQTTGNGNETNSEVDDSAENDEDEKQQLKDDKQPTQGDKQQSQDDKQQTLDDKGEREPQKQEVRIEWAELEPVEWIPGGYILGEKQFTAKATPKEAKIRYSCSQEGPLEVGDYKVTATVDGADTTEGASVTRKLSVTKAKTGLRWKAKPEAFFTHGGFLLTKEFLDRTIDNPKQLKLVFTPAPGTRLPVKDNHPLTVVPEDKDHYDATPVTTTLNVKRGIAKVTWEVPERIDWTRGWLDALMNARTEPPAIGLKYDPDDGDGLAGYVNLKLSLADDELTDWQLIPATVSRKIQVIATDAYGLYQSQEKGRKIQEEKSRTAPKSKLSSKELEELRQRREANKKLANELAEKDVEQSRLTSEFPFGAANAIPHIHSYPSGFHLKIMVGSKIKRMNLVQDGTKYKSVPETLAVAWEYDQENGTNIKKILETMLAGY